MGIALIDIYLIGMHLMGMHLMRFWEVALFVNLPHRTSLHKIFNYPLALKGSRRLLTRTRKLAGRNSYVPVCASSVEAWLPVVTWPWYF
jgi:hypothetical protein